MGEQRHNRSGAAARAVSVVLASALLSGCAHSVVDRVPFLSPASASYVPSTDAEVARCAADIGRSKGHTAAAIDGGHIRVVNWNIRKRRHPDLRGDLDALAAEKDLVLIQEASLREDTIVDNDATRHWSFAPGYRIGGEITGTMTLSSVAPLTQCSLVVLEPLLRTPKTTSVTEYAMLDSSETLVVVNVHAVNLTLGLEAFRQQFEYVATILASHDGPVILSGDFNTWRQERTRIVDDLTASLGLEAVAFANDHRVRFLGQPLDHIYVRGLRAAAADTEVVRSSDHNPMSVVLSVDRLTAQGD